MDRLTTKIFTDGTIGLINLSDIHEINWCDENGKNRESTYGGKAIKRLAAYEDTGLMPDEIPNLKAQLNAAIADLKSCKLDRVRTCANYQKCFDKAKEEFRMMPCMSKSCPGWEWRGSQLPKATT